MSNNRNIINSYFRNLDAEIESLETNRNTNDLTLDEIELRINKIKQSIRKMRGTLPSNKMNFDNRRKYNEKIDILFELLREIEIKKQEIKRKELFNTYGSLIEERSNQFRKEIALLEQRIKQSKNPRNNKEIINKNYNDINQLINNLQDRINESISYFEGLGFTRIEINLLEIRLDDIERLVADLRYMHRERLKNINTNIIQAKRELNQTALELTDELNVLTDRFESLEQERNLSTNEYNNRIDTLLREIETLITKTVGLFDYFGNVKKIQKIQVTMVLYSIYEKEVELQNRIYNKLRNLKRGGAKKIKKTIKKSIKKTTKKTTKKMTKKKVTKKK